MSKDSKIKESDIMLQIKITLRVRINKTLSTEDIPYISYEFTEYKEANEFIKKLQWMKQNEVLKIHGFWYSDNNGFTGYYYISEDGEMWKMEI